MNQRIQMLKEKWRNINTPIKITIGTALLALILFILFSLFMPDKYQVLYSGLTEKDETKIEKYLSDKGVDYKIDSENSGILVNGDTIKIKKELALEGLPEGDTSGGLDNFNNLSLGSTKYDKDVQYQNALQDELNKSLEEMFDGISSADVKLPKDQEQSIFTDEKTDKKVSVALKLKSGYELSSEQVKAVQVYVAGAINDVKADDVQVVDQNLNPLSSTDTKETSLSKQRQIVDETKKQLEKELESALSEVYGRVKVIVSVDINFDEIVRNITKYDPEGTLVSKEEDIDKSRKITGDDATIPGTDTNGEVPNYEMKDVDSKNILSVEDKDKIIQNFKVGETVEKVIKQPELRNTNVSIWFDDTTLTQPDLYDAEEMVAVASGLTGEVKRVANDKAVYDNGSVKVTKKNFAQELDKGSSDDTTESGKGFFSKIPWYGYVGAGLLLVVLIGLIVFFVLRSKKKKVQLSEEEMIYEETIPLQEEKIKNEDSVTKENDDELEGLEDNFNIEWNKEQKDLRSLTNEVAKKFPKETADVISKMLKK